MNHSPDDPGKQSQSSSGGKADFSKVTGGSDTSAERTSDAPKADFSQVTGGSDTSAERTGPQEYVVEKGDTLSAISKKVYGNANRWQAIFEANRDQLDNPDRIQPGQRLTIPAAGDNAG